MYKISIIVPVFNVEDTLSRAFNSIIKQSIGFENLEVILVDDNSTDKSGNIIKNYSKEYDNVKAIFLDENSGFAGKPRNIGIENSTADYLMFLDPDDIFLENACEILYKNITQNNLEIVSGNYNINKDSKITQNNWDMIKLENNSSIQIKTIKENFNLLLTNPSVWSKIFKKDFVLKENLKFLEGVPAQDLVFVSEALLKANGIKFINIPIVEYIPRQTGDDKSISYKRTKNVLAGLIKSYTQLYVIAFNHDKEYAWIGPRHLFFWIKQFCLSKLLIQDKIDLLLLAEPLFKEFIRSDKIKPPEYLDEFLELINKKDYLNASKLSEKLDIFYDEQILIDTIKNKDIFLLFYGLDIEIGGLAKVTFNRAKLLKQAGFKPILLNLNESINFEYIIDTFHNLGYLDSSIEIINIIHYYALKNTFNETENHKHDIEGEYLKEKKEKKDNTKIIDYYNPKNLLVKSVHYFNKYSCIKTYNDKTELITEEYYTNDNFKYLTIIHNLDNNMYTLHDRKTNSTIEFENMFEFHDYFITQILLNCKNKPFLINENAGRIPNFNNIDSNLAYKIASIHTNPYDGKHHYGSPLKADATILENTNNLEYIVVLTEALKEDLINELNVKNIKTILNVINIDGYENKSLEKKELNKFSIFARLSAEKNISDAIKAFEIVVRERNDAILEIFGRAVTNSELIEEKRLKNIVSQLNLENNVIFKGHTDNVYEEMSKSIATLFVSNYEGLGMVVIESMINSTPVISFDVPYGPSDFIVNDENGYLVKQYDVQGLAECILKLLDNPEKSVKMGQLAHEHVLKQINIKNILSKWEDVLKEVYVNSVLKDMKIREEIVHSNESKELKKLERLKIKLYKENHRLYRENKYLKQQIQIKNTSKLKKIFKKIKF